MIDGVRVTAYVSGRVQGVGFRWWVRRRALALDLRGSAANLDDGRVEIVVEGPRGACQQLLDELRGPDAPGLPSGIVERWAGVQGVPVGFTTS